jgi:hypothetical protein
MLSEMPAAAVAARQVVLHHISAGVFCSFFAGLMSSKTAPRGRLPSIAGAAPASPRHSVVTRHSPSRQTDATQLQVCIDWLL